MCQLLSHFYTDSESYFWADQSKLGKATFPREMSNFPMQFFLFSVLNHCSWFVHPQKQMNLLPTQFVKWFLNCFGFYSGKK